VEKIVVISWVRWLDKFKFIFMYICVCVRVCVILNKYMNALLIKFVGRMGV
jgi:hypothetical protein